MTSKVLLSIIFLNGAASSYATIATNSAIRFIQLGYPFSIDWNPSMVDIPSTASLTWEERCTKLWVREGYMNCYKLEKAFYTAHLPTFTQTVERIAVDLDALVAAVQEKKTPWTTLYGYTDAVIHSISRFIEDDTCAQYSWINMVTLSEIFRMRGNEAFLQVHPELRCRATCMTLILLA